MHWISTYFKQTPGLPFFLALLVGAAQVSGNDFTITGVKEAS